MSCSAKHYTLQIPMDEFKCPKCGATPDGPGGGFVVDDPAIGADDECGKDHEDDALVCYNCGYSTSGGDFSRAYAKKASLVKCPCCKGNGKISPKKAAEIEAILARKE